MNHYCHDRTTAKEDDPEQMTKKHLKASCGYCVTGAQWNELPAQYGNPMTCWRRLHTWQKQGVWKQIWETLLGTLNRQDKIIFELFAIDATFAPAKKGGQKLVSPSAVKEQR